MSVFGSGRKSVLVLHTYVLRVQYNCGVLLVFWSWREIATNFMYVFSVQYSCGVVNITGKIYDRKKRYSHLALLEYVSKYKHQLWPEKITTGKKRYSRLAYTICNTRNILFFLCLYLKGGNKLNVGIVCLKVKHLHKHIKHASPWWSCSLAQAAWPWVISQCPQLPSLQEVVWGQGASFFVNSMVWQRNNLFW